MWYLIVNWATLIFLVLLLAISYIYFKKIHSYWENRGIPYEKPVFLAGSLWEVFSGKRQIGKHLGDLYKKYTDPYFGIYICGKPYLVLRSPEIIKQITIRDFSNFEDRTFACDKDADDMTGNSLFIIRNPDWRNIRNKLSSIFTSGKLRNMYPFMTETSQEMVKYLGRHDNEILEIKDVAGRYMTDLVAKCFFGIDNNSFVEKEASEFRKVCIKLFELDLYRSFCLFSYFFVPKFVTLLKLKLMDTRYLRDVFLETLSVREKSGIKRNDFVDLLISVRDAFQEDTKKGNFDTTCMVAQAITFFIAGFETTSNLLGFTLYELSLRPDCQEKLRQEIFELFGDDCSTPMSFDKIQQMQYLDMVIAETLRRYPFGPFLNRNCKEDYVIEQTGFKIEKGTPVLIPLDGIHFDPAYYKDPELFEPERFRDGYKQLYNSCVYMPFGLGPRNCIGDRFGQICAKVGLVHFLRSFQVERCDLTPVPLVLNPKSPFMTPVNGLRLRVKKFCKV
ncbi:cytochrome P450 6k1-like [Anthonomus grandis grandis]|uniref:cytochrome P450 6k1-like n=1 Tax=Anthonomus grandis grandis TaxID=2921223 RepID=UPI002165334F|nr:cytochrome P450 6k1-like [Anthonomus grandis grandis]